MPEPVIAQKGPYPVAVEAGKSLLSGALADAAPTSRFAMEATRAPNSRP